MAKAADPARELPEAPDHIAVELAFLSWLHLKEAFALVEADAESAALCRSARDGFYAETARLLRDLRPQPPGS